MCNGLHLIKYVLALKFGRKNWIWCAEANMFDTVYWIIVVLATACPFNASFLLPSLKLSFHSQVYRCPLSVLWQCSLKYGVISLFFFVEWGLLNEQRCLYIQVCCAGWKKKMAQHKPYRLTGFEIQRLWKCRISIGRTKITQSNVAVERIALQQRCIYYYVNPSSLSFVSYG